MQKGVFKAQEFQPHLGEADDAKLARANCEPGMMRIAGIHSESIVDGPGLRMTIFTQGCPHGCEGCHNPETHDPAKGELVRMENVAKRIEEDARHKCLDGITLSGGEPFMQPYACLVLATEARFYGLSVWCYTGYTFEELLKRGRMIDKLLLSKIDVLVDGPFVKRLRTMELPFRGSSNQRLIDVAASLQAGKTILYEEDAHD